MRLTVFFGLSRVHMVVASAKAVQGRSMRRQNYFVRRAIVSEFLEIAKLDREVWGSAEHPEKIPDGEHVWRLWVEYSTVFVALVEERIVGAALLFRANDLHLDWLHKIFVERDSRNRGIGRALFSTIAHYLDQSRIDCLLTTAPTNSRMLRLCEAFGFSEKTFVRGFYRWDEPLFTATSGRSLAMTHGNYV